MHYLVDLPVSFGHVLPLSGLKWLVCSCCLLVWTLPNPPFQDLAGQVLTLQLSFVDLLARFGVAGHLVRLQPTSPILDAN